MYINDDKFWNGKMWLEQLIDFYSYLNRDERKAKHSLNETLVIISGIDDISICFLFLF